MQLFFLSLLFYLLVLSQQLLTVVFLVTVLWVWVSVLFGLLLWSVVFYELLRVCIFGERVVAQIDASFLLIAGFYFFLDVWFVIADEVHIVIVDSFALPVGNRFFFDYFDFSVSFPSCLRFSLQQVSFEVFLFELV